MDDLLVQVFSYDSLDVLMDKYLTLTMAMDNAQQMDYITNYETTIYLTANQEYILEFLIWSRK